MGMALLIFLLFILQAMLDGLFIFGYLSKDSNRIFKGKLSSEPFRSPISKTILRCF